MTLGFNDGDGAQAQDPQQLTDRWQYSVVAGCVVSPGTNDMTVECDAGEAIIAGERMDIAAQDNVSLDAAHPDYPRKVTVYLDTTGTLQVANGTAEPPLPETQTHEQTRRPAPPPVADATILAEVWVPAAASDIAAGDVRDRRLDAELAADRFDGGTHAFDTFQDHGRFQMVHLNTWNWGGNSKVTEATHTISDFTDKPIYKVLLIAEHISVYSSTASDQTFALQINGQNTDWENRRIDGSYTVGDAHAIVTKGAANQAPWLGHIWIQVDQDIRVRPEGSVRGEGPADSHVDFCAHDASQTERPFTVDSIRYFTPDGDEIRMRRATMFGFTPSTND